MSEAKMRELLVDSMKSRALFYYAFYKEFSAEFGAAKAEEVMKRIIEEKVTPPTAVRRDYPPALELIVMRALEHRPEDRYQSAEEMRVDLEEFLADEGLRTGTRRMGLYMNEIFAPDANPTKPAQSTALSCIRRRIPSCSPPFRPRSPQS